MTYVTIEILWYLKLSKSFKCNKNWQNDKLLRAYWSAIIILYSNCQSNLLMDGVMVYFTIYFTESGLGDDVWNICCQKLEYLIIFDSPFESSRFSIVSRFSSLVVFRNFDFWGAQIFLKTQFKWWMKRISNKRLGIHSHCPRYLFRRFKISHYLCD